MKSLVHALHRRRGSGVPLPDRFPSLAANGIRFRRGQVHMIAGQPGSGKSLLSLDYAVHAGVSCLYFSADSDEDTVFNRVGAMRMGMSVSSIEEMRETPAVGLLEEELSNLSNVRFVYDAQPTLDTITDEVDAWEEVYGQMPDLIVVDNLINVVCETTDNEWQGLRHLMGAMHEIARDTGAAMLILHHTSEGEGKPTDCQPRKALMGKVAQLPEVILTIALDPAENVFKVAGVKNRTGKADALARNPIELGVDLPKMHLFERQLVTSEVPNSAVAQYWSEIQ